MKKTIKNGSLYFRQRDILRPLGGAFLIIGLLWLYFGWGLVGYIVSCTIVPLGLIFFIVGGSRLISDNDLAEQITHAMEDYDKSITDLPHFDRAVLPQPAPVECRAYSFGTEASYFKKNKSGSPVSDILTGAHFFFTRDSLLIAARTVCLATSAEIDGLEHRDFSDTLPFSALIEAKLDEHTDSVKLTNTGKNLTVKWCELVLTVKDENNTPAEALRIAVPNDMDTATLCEEINRRAGK